MLGRRRSFAEAVQSRRKTARRLGILFLVFLSYECLSGLFLSAFWMRSQAMSPTVQSGDRLLASPLAYGPRTIFGKLPGLGRPEHGDIVVVEPNYVRRLGFWEKFADAFVRFVTFQLVSISSGGPDGMLAAPTLQRVVGVPGDTIRMDDFVFKVKTAGSDQFLTEFELSTSRYDISHVAPPELWRSDMPGSGQLAETTLGPDQYFLAGDARSSSSDSRLWGPVGTDRFKAKVLLRYWPPKRFGTP